MACRRLFLFPPLSPCTIYVFISETRQIRKQNRFLIYPFLSVLKFKPWANVPSVVGRWEERRGGERRRLNNSGGIMEARRWADDDGPPSFLRLFRIIRYLITYSWWYRGGRRTGDDSRWIGWLVVVAAVCWGEGGGPSSLFS